MIKLQVGKIRLKWKSFDLDEDGWHAYVYYETDEDDQTHVKIYTFLQKL